jgi:hypothetical protein
MSLTTMRNYSEKRDFIRMKVDTTITLTNPDNGHQYQGICRDLSGTGMSIEVDKFFLTDTELNTTLPSNNDAFPPFDTTIRVMRCTETDDNKFLLGAEIISLRE